MNPIKIESALKADAAVGKHLAEKQEWIIKLPGEGYYWNPPVRHVAPEDRFCASQLAATKFKSERAAAEVARTIPGSKPVPYERY